MSKIAIINDSHFGVRNDSPFFLESSLNYYSNVFFPYVEKHNIRTIFHLGDFFDRRKYINFNTLREVRKRFLEQISPTCEFHIILGNHDTYYKNTNEINSIKEIFRGYTNIIIYDSPSTIEIDGMQVSLIPWINDTNKSEYLKYINESNSSILMGHFEILGFEVIDGVKHQSGIEVKEFNKFEMVLSGHFHLKQTKRNIHYLGTQFQLNFGDVNCPKGFHVLDTDTREITFIENSNTIFNIIRYDDSDDDKDMLGVDLDKYKNTFVKVLVKCKNKPFIFDKFIDKLYSIDTQELTILDDHTEKQENTTIDVTEDTISIINKEIDELEIDLNKDKLKLIVKDLYMETTSL